MSEQDDPESRLDLVGPGVPRLARAARVSPKVMYKLIENGHAPWAFKVGGRYYARLSQMDAALRATPQEDAQ